MDDFTHLRMHEDRIREGTMAAARRGAPAARRHQWLRRIAGALTPTPAASGAASPAGTAPAARSAPGAGTGASGPVTATSGGGQPVGDDPVTAAPAVACATADDGVELTAPAR